MYIIGKQTNTSTLQIYEKSIKDIHTCKRILFIIPVNRRSNKFY